MIPADFPKKLADIFSERGIYDFFGISFSVIVYIFTQENFPRRKEYEDMILVCSHHVKDALKMMLVPHVKAILEENQCCQLCKNHAKYKLFDYTHQRNHTKKAI